MRLNLSFLFSFLLSVFCLLSSSPVAQAACTAVTGNPTPGPGDWMYNADYHIPQYCDGTNWMQLGQARGVGGTGCAAVGGFTDGENADNVLGQADFTSSTAATTQAGMKVGGGVTYDSAHRRLFVVDTGSSRVLEYDLSGGITDGMNATHVLGQSNFTSSGTATSQSGMRSPYDVTYDSANDRLFVADTFNERVLEYDLSGGITDGMNATHVLGQSNFTSGQYNRCNCATAAANTMYSPYGVAYDSASSRLFVAERDNNRVLEFDLSGGITDGMNATHVLGQSNFTTYASATTQTGMKGPRTVAYDSASNRLFEADASNNRVLEFDLSGGITDGMNATHVLGQSSFTTSTGAITQAGMSFPTGVAFDAADNRLFVTDYSNNRVLEFDLSGGITDGMNATHVLGQSSFTTKVNVTTQAGMNSPYNTTYDATNSRLFVGDTTNNRVLVFPVPYGSGPGAEGDVIYNADKHVPQFCGGTNWIPMAEGWPTAGLVAWWKLDESSPATAADSSGNGNNLTVTGTTIVAGKLGNGRSETGSDVLGIPINASLFNLTRFTASVWIKTTSLSSAATTALFDHGNYPNSGWSISDDGPYSSNVYFRVENGTAHDIQIPRSTVNDGNWHLLTGTYDGTTQVFYLDGASYGSQTVGYTVNNASGMDMLPTPSGSIAYDDVRIYNRALSAQEVATLALTTSPTAGCNPTTSGLVGWWKLDDGSGTTAADSSGNGHNGTIQNSPTWTTGKIGEALTFNGTSQYVSIPSASLFLSGSWTVSAWVNMATLLTAGDNRASVFHSSASYAHVNYWLGPENNDSPCVGGLGWELFFTSSAGTKYTVCYATTMNTGTWYLVTGVWDSSSSNLYLYLNGALVATQNTAGAVPDASAGGEGTLASANGGSATDLPGTLDDVRVYNRALSATEVSALYNGGREGDIEYNSDAHAMQYCDGVNWQQMGSRENTAYSGGSGLVGWWKLDDGIGAFSDGELAANVLGQSDFVTGTGTLSQSGMNGPGNFAFDAAHNRLFVPDYTNNRVLVYDTSAISNGMNAVHVLGQSNFTTGTAAHTSTGMSGPLGATYDSVHDRLFVADTDNNRVLEYDLSGGDMASDDFNRASVGSNWTSITTGSGGWAIYNNAEIEETSGDTVTRFLEWNANSFGNDQYSQITVTSLSGVGANRYLHACVRLQGSDPESGYCYAVQALGSSTYCGLDRFTNGSVSLHMDNDPSGNTMCASVGDTIRIEAVGNVITAYKNGTVVAGPVTDTTYTSGRPGIATYQNDGSVRGDNWSAGDLSIRDGMAASHVLGQPDFTSNQANQGGANPAANTLYWPYDVTYDAVNDRLFALDTYNHRVLVYDLAPPTTSGLVDWWKFDDGSGTTAKDSAGSLTGTVNGTATWTTGMNGGALSFDGATNYVDMGTNHPCGTGACTVSAWLYANSSAATYEHWIDFGYQAMACELYLPNMRYACSNDSFTHSASTANNALVYNQWILVTGVRTASGQITMYVNGVQSGSADQNGGTMNIGTQHFTIGNRYNGSTYFFDGLIDDVRVYNRALSAAEVADLYNNGITDGMNAAHVLGQADFVSGYGNRCNGCESTSVNANTLWHPDGLDFDSTSQRLFVADFDNNRVLEYDLSGGTTSGLVGRWKLDEASGTSAVDSSGNGNTGTLQNSPTWTTGMYGGALTFSNGSDTYVDIANPSNFNFEYSQPFTLTAWIYRTNTTTEGDLIAKHLSGGAGYDIWMLPDGGSYHSVSCTTNCISGLLANNTNANSDIFVMASGTTAAPNAWHHVAMTYDGSSTAAGIKIYVDGVPQTVVAGSDTLSGSITAAADLKIGTDVPGDSDAFTGKIDDVRVYNRALSAGEVSALYNNGSITDGMNATYVLGQTSWTTRGSATTRSGMYEPVGVGFDPTHNRLFVGDDYNNRVTAFDVSPGAMAACAASPPCNATNEIGQPSGASQWTTKVSATTQSGLFKPHKVAYDAANNRLFVDDSGNNRVMVYPATSLGAGSLTDGLAVWWKFDEASGNGAADSSGNGNSGGVTGSTIVAGKINNARSFASADYAAAPSSDSLSNLSQFTAAFWIKTNGLNSTAQTDMVDKSFYNASGFDIFDNGPNSANVNCLLNTSGSNYSLSIARSLVNDNTWHHLACTYDGSTVRFYLDGVEQANGSYSAYIPDNTHNFAVGGGFWGGAAGAETIDDVRIYNRALSAAQVAALYNYTGSSVPSTAADSSGNGHTGTLVNSPTWTTGKLAGALTFDGSFPAVDIPDTSSLNISGAWTASAWVKLIGFPTSGNFSQFMGRVSDSTGDVNYRIGIEYWDPSPTFFASFDGTSATYYAYDGSGEVLTTGTWYHVAAVWDPSVHNLYLYINGALVGTQNTGSDTPQYGFSDDPNLSGSTITSAMILDDARIYNRALSAAEIRDLYDSSN